MSKDSMEVEMKEQKVRLYKEAQIDYEDIVIKADYIEINFEKNELFATGWPDSSGRIVGKPVFKEPDSEFKADEIRYNFDSKKGLIKKINTQEGDGYLHGNNVKKLPDDVINIRNGAYTTCDAEHPHFAIQFTKAKVIPDQKIITGPAYLSIEDLPTPICIPFAFFPLKKGRASGILVPEPGQSQRQGFYLKNGGYYFGLNDYWDLELRGDIYTNLSWASKVVSKYNKRYKYNGAFSLSYAYNKFGEKELADFNNSKDFKIQWSHTKNPKARPNSTFSANVNAGTSKFNKINTYNSADRLNNTLQSNVSYSKNFNNRFNFSANLRHSQNTLNRRVSLNLPEITFSMNRIYPFRRKNISNPSKFYKNVSQNVSVSYVMNAQNQINVLDTNLFRKTTLDSLRNGITHSIPIQSSIKLLKYITWSNSFNYTERWYLSSIRKIWDDSLNSVFDTIIPGPESNRDFNYTSSLSFKLYGMAQFKRFPIRALRHVVTPSFSYTIRPDFSDPKWNFYKSYINGLGDTVKYSIFEDGIYGGPPAGKMGSVSLNISNNIEMKVRSKKDTITGMKKVVLIENLTMAASYNLADVDLKWSTLSVSGRTRLFKSLDIRYTSIWDPYVVDSMGIRYPVFEKDVNNRILRQNNNQWATSFNWQLRPEKIFGPSKNPYRIPWSLNFDYTFSYTNLIAPVFIWMPSTYSSHRYMKSGKEPSLVQTLGLSASLSITSKMSVSVRTGYDFEKKLLSYTTVDIKRDLHCWEMAFSWIPTGLYKSYTFTIRAKAAMLQDLKYEKRKDHKDNF